MYIEVDVISRRKQRVAGCLPEMAEKKVQVRFSYSDDVKLLLEVSALNPFANKGKWGEVADKVNAAVNRENFCITSRRARKRTSLLLDSFKKRTIEGKNSSGIEEEYGEKDMLLQDIKDLLDEEDRQKETEKKRKSEEEQKAVDVRKRALETLTPEKVAKPGKPDEPVPSKRVTVMSYLQQKANQENELKAKELELKEKELALQQERFELERQERVLRMQQEREERGTFMALIQNILNKKD